MSITSFSQKSDVETKLESLSNYITGSAGGWPNSSYAGILACVDFTIESGSDNYQYLTSHTAKEYLRQGGPLTVVRVGEPEGNTAKATANIDLTLNITGSTDTIFTLEALGDGPQFNNFVGTGSEMGTDSLLPRRTTSRSNEQLLSGSYGGRGDNF